MKKKPDDFATPAQKKFWERMKKANHFSKMSKARKTHSGGPGRTPKQPPPKALKKQPKDILAFIRKLRRQKKPYAYIAAKLGVTRQHIHALLNPERPLIAQAIYRQKKREIEEDDE